MVLRVFIVSLMCGLTITIVVVISLFMVVFRQYKRSLHDSMAATYVERLDPTTVDSSKLI